ncbi:6-carboxytetrahydropterin synthase [Methanoculleus bourgensis]|jgi:6-pyruvoyltetrahydropterin/6-carboxytetrahydropterin synthase|uniref:6-carboxytetrahydropterin synthase n=1 Tax=Methanoculleus bourgensis TaxID=83986 RepID=A0A0X3BM59_9EURY|nr:MULTISPECIES: 6-carboxytetrahydropterin synthase [Methanoculleus]MBT0732825.1 6-carboxytetrahydropterin synthase [Methanoculleus bourgensis]MDD3372301.1 6-carboxytetrahydropterin synthase [Methanoculleus bourgensis]NMA89553.1 6-carboxytetrahydropterin synthase [Methanoculleus bourgensis]NQS77781.1 6-carboxytetrahydropterin synthase [Methanoculleus bourgensis]CVK33073.1 6-pyruvoyl tetrahydrobiopterin synthase [Methanoculleus bourgensis]
MITRIYKEVFFEATHRLIHYRGKCFRLHGHQWRVEVWIEGTADERTGIVLDYNCIKEVVGRFDHQVILNADDPMAASIEAFHPVVTTPGDPTSELIAAQIADMINAEAARQGLDARVAKIRVWESTSCYAERTYDRQ